MKTINFKIFIFFFCKKYVLYFELTTFCILYISRVTTFTSLFFQATVNSEDIVVGIVQWPVAFYF